MLAIQLKNYLKKLPDTTNILIFSSIIKESRQLVFSDLDKDSNGNIIIDAEYKIPPKTIYLDNIFEF